MIMISPTFTLLDLIFSWGILCFLVGTPEPLPKMDDFVTVSLRIRPVLGQDSTDSSCLQVISKQPPVLLVLDRAQTYHFDNIFKEEVDQETVYKETVEPLVEYVKQGYSCTVFAYGQTGTGKTYTMGTNSQKRHSRGAGLIPRALEQFFSYCDSDIETDISVSFLEIYNEKVFDLLQNNKPPLTVKGFRVEGLSEEKVRNFHEAKQYFQAGNRNRHSSETKQNPNSSRSHAIFTIHCHVRHKDHETTAKLNLVDLAGCESVRKTGNQGSTFQEGVNINMGLLCIGQVMTALSTNASFIPYRQSVITTILQDSLNRKNLVSLIACVKGNPEDCNDTVQTLEFAQRVKKMKNKPEVNEVVMRYKKNNPTLFQPVKTAGTPFKRPGSVFQTPHLSKRVKALPLRTVNEASGADSPKSLSSISVCSIASKTEVAQQSLSPVVKKYVAAMESTLTDKIEILIKSTLRSTRSSSLTKEKETGNKQNTPSMSWDKIQNEVSKLVRTEIAQLTSRAVRAASSPLDELVSFGKIRRVLKYDSPVLENAGNVNLPKEKTVFKVPLTKRKSAEGKRTPSISPIEFVPRRSTRLTLKRTGDSLKEDSDASVAGDMDSGKEKDFNKSNCREFWYEKQKCSEDSQRNVNESEDDFQEEIVFKVPEPRVAKKKSAARKRVSSISCTRSVPRRSVRLSLKRVVDQTGDSDSESSGDSTFLGIQRGINECHYEKRRTSVRLAQKQNELKDRHTNVMTREENNNSLDDFELEATAEIVNGRERVRLNKKTKDATKDKINADNINTKSIKAAPAVRKILNGEASVDSPATARTKHVLTLLNSGTVKELEKLHTIGPKTAQQILLFRDIKGPLKKMSDLSLMPGWHGKKYKIFVEQNFVKDLL